MRSVLIFLWIFFVVVSVGAQTLEWQNATVFSGTGNDRIRDIFVDDLSNVYITGRFSGVITLGQISLTSNGNFDIFAAKMDSNGDCVWAVSGGGTNFDEALAIDVDSLQNVYICGQIEEENVNENGSATFGNFTVPMNGDRDIFIAKISNDGAWEWVTHSGGSRDDMMYDLKLDHLGNLYCAGQLSSTAQFGNQIINHNGSDDALLAKLDTSGNWIWIRNMGTTETDCAYGLDIGPHGNIYTTGHYGTGYTEVFLWKTDPAGIDLLFTCSDGQYYELGFDIVVDQECNSYISINYENILSLGGQNITGYDHIDMAIAKLDSTGNCLWVANAGGTYEDRTTRLDICDSGDIITSGYFMEQASFGNIDASNAWRKKSFFIGSVDPQGSWKWVQSVSHNSIGSSIGMSVFVISDSTFYVAGELEAPTQFDTLNVNQGLGNEAFYGLLQTVEQITGAEEDLSVKEVLSLSNYPNPFNPETRIEYSLPEDGEVSLDIFNIKGQKVNTLVKTYEVKGSHSVIWNGKDQSGNKCGSGIYFYRLSSGSTSKTSKMILMK